MKASHLLGAAAASAIIAASSSASAGTCLRSAPGPCKFGSFFSRIFQPLPAVTTTVPVASAPATQTITYAIIRPRPAIPMIRTRYVSQPRAVAPPRYVAAPRYIAAPQANAPVVRYQTMPAPAPAPVQQRIVYRTMPAPAPAPMPAPVIQAPVTQAKASVVRYETMPAPALSPKLAPITYKTVAVPAPKPVPMPAPVYHQAAPAPVIVSAPAPAPVVTTQAAPRIVYNTMPAPAPAVAAPAPAPVITYNPAPVIAAPAPAPAAPLVTYNKPASVVAHAPAPVISNSIEPIILETPVLAAPRLKPPVLTAAAPTPWSTQLYVAPRAHIGQLDNTGYSSATLSSPLWADVGHDRGYGGSIALGAETNASWGGIRAELEVGRDQYDVETVENGGALLANASGDTEITYAFLNGYVEPKITDSVNLILGAGAGMGEVELHHTAELADGSTATVSAGKDRVLGFHADAGLSVDVTDSVALEAIYRYQDFVDAEIGNSELDLSSHNLLAGVRVGF